MEMDSKNNSEMMESFEVLPNCIDSLDSSSSEFSVISDPSPLAEGCALRPTSVPNVTEEQRLVLELQEEASLLKEKLLFMNTSMKSQLSGVTSTIAQQQVSLQEAETMLQEANARVQELEKEKAQMKKFENDSESKKNLEQIYSLTANLVDYEQRLKEKKEKVAELTNKLALAKKEKEQREETDSKLKKTQEEVYSLKAGLVDYEKQLTEKEANVDALTNELGLVKEELQQRKETDNELKRTQEEIYRLKAGFFDCEQQLKEKEAKVDLLTNELVLANKKLEESEETGKKFKELQVECCKIYNRLYYCEKQLAENETKVGMLVNELNLTKEEFMKKLDLSEETASELEEANAEIVRLEAGLVNCEQRLAEKETKVGMLTNKLDLAIEKKAQIDSEFVKAKEEIKNMTNHFLYYQQQLTNELDRTKKELQQKTQAMAQQLIAHSNSKGDYEMQLEGYEEEIETLTVELDSTKAELERKTALIGQMGCNSGVLSQSGAAYQQAPASSIGCNLTPSGCNTSVPPNSVFDTLNSFTYTPHNVYATPNNVFGTPINVYGPYTPIPNAYSQIVNA